MVQVIVVREFADDLLDGGMSIEELEEASEAWRGLSKFERREILVCLCKMGTEK